MNLTTKRIMASLMSAALTAAVLGMLPSEHIFAAGLTAKQYYESIGVSKLPLSEMGSNSSWRSSTAYGARTGLANNAIAYCPAIRRRDPKDGKYKIYFSDPRRKIRVVGSLNYCPNPSFQPRLPLKEYVFDTSVRYQNDTAVQTAERQNVYGALMSNAVFAYDYFTDLGFSDYTRTDIEYNPDTDGLYADNRTDGTIYLSLVDGNFANDSSFDMFNAVSDYNLISSGAGDGSTRRFTMADKDVTVHELTHLITQKKLGWSGGIEFGAEARNLAEAYGDIFGELADPTPDWKIGTDVFYANDSAPGTYCIRDIANPNSYNRPGMTAAQRKTFYTDYKVYKDAQITDHDLQWDHYAGSTIISHAAYVMAQTVPKNDLAKIWLKSMDKYEIADTANASFADCRKAVEAAAVEFLFDKYDDYTASRYFLIISNAFDDANIQSSLTQSAAESSSTMNSFVNTEKSKLPHGRYWTTGNPDTTNSYSPGGFDLSTAMTGGPLVLNSFRQSYWQYVEAYYQCAGFAKKLQCDYFGTYTALQNTNESAYQLKPGDHLRIYYDMPFGAPVDRTSHSIFIISVNGNSFTYADCNANGDCKILWNQNGSYTKSNGVYTFKLAGDNTNYKFEFVERPIKIGDVNADGVLNWSDYSEMSPIINGTAQYKQYDCYYRRLAADANRDGIVDYTDRNIVYDIIYNRNNARSTYGYV